MKVIKTDIEGVLIIEPRVFGDDRGFFYESYNQQRYSESVINTTFVQDNISMSGNNVLRGLHYQQHQPQGKLVSVLQGEVYDVAVDIRKGSPTFKQWVGVNLSGDNHRQFFIPEGFAHGFFVLSDTALFNYKCTSAYKPDDEHTLIYNDPDIGIDWPCDVPVVSEKDANGLSLAALTDYLPIYSSISG